MSKQTVYNILASAKKQPIKTDLAIYNEMTQLIALLDEYTNAVKSLKVEAKKLMSELDAAQTKGIQNFKNLKSMQSEYGSQLKELGLDVGSNRLYNNAEAVLDKWSDANSMKI